MGKRRTLAARARAHLAVAGRRALARQDGGSAGLLRRAVSLLSEGAYDARLERDLADATLHQWTAAGEIVTAMDSLAARAAAQGNHATELDARLVAGRRPPVHRPTARSMSSRRWPGRRFRARGRGRRARALRRLACHRDGEHGRMQNARKLAASEKAVEYARMVGDERLASQLVLRSLPMVALTARHPSPSSVSWIDLQEAAGRRHSAFIVIRGLALAMLGRFDEARAIHDGRVPPRRRARIAAASVHLLHRRSASERRPATPWRPSAGLGRDAAGWRPWAIAAWLSTAAGVLGECLCRLGRYDEADEQAERSRSLGAADDLATQMVWRRARAIVLAHRGEAEEAGATRARGRGDRCSDR